jgi:peptidoglycan/LPS O-acetylase OafA/YrhL
MSTPRVSKTHIPHLDGWRGLAIVFLLVGHFFPVPGINLGAVGVALFFVLSGFLMSKILFIDRVPLRIFYRRRIARILPSVAVFLLAVALAYLATGREISPYELFSAATFTNNYFVIPETWTMPVGHLWSLSVEEHAYILLSLLALLCRARNTSGQLELGVVAGLAAILALIYWLVFGAAQVPGMWLHTEVAAFGLMLSGFALLAFRRKSPAPPRHAASLLVMLGIAAYWWRSPPPFMLVGGGAAFALALNLLDRSPGRFRTMLELRPLRQLGIWSFSLYLWQQPFYMLTHREGLPAPLALAGSLVVGVTAFYLIENPARTWLNRASAKNMGLAPGKDEVSVQPSGPASAGMQ